MFGFTLHVINSKSLYTIQFDEVELLNSSYLESFYNFSKLSVTKFNRSTFVLNLEAELLTDLNEDFLMDVAIYLKRKPGSSWSKNLYFYPNYYFCDAMKKYRHYTMKDFKNFSNFPQYDENENDGCLFPKVNCCFADVKRILLHINYVQLLYRAPIL